MTEKRLLEILESIKQVKIGVFGDFCLDSYWLLDDGPIEYSIETNKRTFSVKKQKYSLGGAGNVVWNMADLGVQKVYAVGVIGDDLFGREMLRKMEGLKIDTSSIIIQKNNWDTPVYAKPFFGLEEQERIDFGRNNHIDENTERELLSNIKKVLNDVDALLINQQLKNGVCSENIITELNNLILQYEDKIFLVDSRDKNDRFRNVILKMNASESARLCGIDTVVSESISIEDIKIFADKIYNNTKKPVFITRGGRGIVAYDGNSFFEVPGILVTGKIDTVGAGDTVASAIISSLSAGATIEEACVISNLAASVTVKKLQVTGTANSEEIIDAYKNVQYVYNPELADDERKSKYLINTEFEIIDPSINLGNIEHILFDHDGTISVLREGWEDIMGPMMIKSILGKNYNTVNEEVYQRVKKRVEEYIEQSTGIETIIQMQVLVDLIKEFGFIPESEILTPVEYKKIYNDELMKKVNYRLKKLKEGELSVDDFVIKGVINFLDYITKNGIKVYLASGTDTEDVIREAECLGYAHYFGEHIYGSLGYKSTNAKKIVINNIIKKHNLSGVQLAAFGDGPVELREVKKVGGIAIGIASDEVRRYGINQIKRSRLIKAGADIIIRDYSSYNKLIDLLFIKKSIKPDDLISQIG
ncbi:MAG TPA: PfkB family carbohydrate kinase [Bacteroidota bacterium]|nr:PfkB family carbohydrate kinase [Bacteroidota bacterium]